MEDAVEVKERLQGLVLTLRRGGRSKKKRWGSWVEGTKNEEGVGKGKRSEKRIRNRRDETSVMI